MSKTVEEEETASFDLGQLQAVHGMQTGREGGPPPARWTAAVSIKRESPEASVGGGSVGGGSMTGSSGVPSAGDGSSSTSEEGVDLDERDCGEAHGEEVQEQEHQEAIDEEAIDDQVIASLQSPCRFRSPPSVRSAGSRGDPASTRDGSLTPPVSHGAKRPRISAADAASSAACSLSRPPTPTSPCTPLTPTEGLAARLPDDLGEFECEYGGEVTVLPPPPRWGLEAAPHPTG